MIPKIIHYCWFGRAPLPDKAKKCIESWRKHCPDYTILEWNEDNFDIHQNGYTEMCCKEKKYAFLADYARLQIIENGGGSLCRCAVHLPAHKLGHGRRAYLHRVPHGPLEEEVHHQRRCARTGRCASLSPISYRKTGQLLCVQTRFFSDRTQKHRAENRNALCAVLFLCDS